MLDYIQIPWHFMIAPFFYTFLMNYLDIANKQRKILNYYIFVFAVMCIAQISFVIYYSDKGTKEELSYSYEKYTSIEEAISLIGSLVAFIYSFIILRNREDLFQKILSFDNLKWIYNFFKLTSLAYLMWIFALVMKFSLDFSGFLFSYYPLRISTTIIILYLGYQGFKYIRILKERKDIRKDIVEEDYQPKEEDIKEQQKNALRYEKQFLDIDLHIKTNKKFLQPKYTLNNLSKEIGLGASTLSAIINNNAKKSFVDYINEMRVEQAKKLLLNTKYEGYTIASIGLESGFNSKSAFYDVFKKHTSQTPLSFKKSKMALKES
ncbi:helix-turn-helix domain-containing protein [Tenacibaculum sp. M341]|uniref:helix-turn-helix domain-containing protein n=1 Tax=Tenacibaculum sp. M341 TaxID=2530339 RepID=UPI0014053C1F|nr:helix-turn-helix domain-containing protein [Tenacibaculum sp. M341]